MLTTEYTISVKVDGSWDVVFRSKDHASFASVLAILEGYIGRANLLVFCG